MRFASFHRARKKLERLEMSFMIRRQSASMIAVVLFIRPLKCSSMNQVFDSAAE
jgi:hypothetical protein